MSSKRSTRRSVNPPEEDDNQEAVGNEGGLADVESILNEIEDLVSGVGTDETARPTSVVENQSQADLKESPAGEKVDSIGEVEDIRQLKDELDAAIADVHESAPTEDAHSIDSTPQSDSSASMDRDESETETEEVKIADEIEIKAGEEESALPITESEGVPSKVVKVLSAPVEALSSGNRLLVTLFAVSMALWVPVVWMAALMTTPEVPYQAPETLFKTDVPPDQGDEILSEK